MYEIEDVVNLEMYTGNKVYSVDEAPFGLLFLLDSGEIICKSQYRINDKPECTIVDGGENFCGDVSQKCVPLLIKF